MKYKIGKYKYLIAFLFIGVGAIISLGIIAPFICQRKIEVRYGLLKPPPCPYCASTKFPPYGFLSGYSPGVYRCEDCDKIWGPYAIAWIIAHPTLAEQELLLPPESRTIGNNIRHDPKHYHSFYLNKETEKNNASLESSTSK